MSIPGRLAPFRFRAACSELPVRNPCRPRLAAAPKHALQRMRGGRHSDGRRAPPPLPPHPTACNTCERAGFPISEVPLRKTTLDRRSDSEIYPHTEVDTQVSNKNLSEAGDIDSVRLPASMAFAFKYSNIRHSTALCPIISGCMICRNGLAARSRTDRL